MSRNRNRLAFVLVAAGILAPVGARAVDRVTYPYPGVMHVHRTVQGLDAHVVTVDLAAGEVDVVATRPGQRSAIVSQWAREQDAQIAINANFFGGSVCGLAMGDGEVWRDAYGPQCSAAVAFGPTGNGWRAELFDTDGNIRRSPVTWATEIVSGMPVLIHEGATYFDDNEPNGMYRWHPRTALGLGADGTSLVILVIDGRRSGLPGATSLEMIPLLEEFGATEAINLDGGGSSALWIENEGGIVNRPSDRHERAVMNHLGIRITTASFRPPEATAP